jgi:hypothetical protein
MSGLVVRRFGFRLISADQTGKQGLRAAWRLPALAPETEFCYRFVL